ncbi:MAG: hypothetical protein LUI13_08535 [Lachnospiraceae bacterium]|nr:hypothetical protein [Lachnospiraceae bacterium]
MTIEPISLSERIRRLENGSAADKKDFAAAMKKSAALPLEEFFLGPGAYTGFMEAVKELHPDEADKIRTYQDAVLLIYTDRRSRDEKMQKLGIRLQKMIADNYMDLYILMRNRKTGWNEKFPVLTLSTRQLYQAASEIRGGCYPDEFYRRMVRPCVKHALHMEEKLKDTVLDMAFYGTALLDNWPDWYDFYGSREDAETDDTDDGDGHNDTDADYEIDEIEDCETDDFKDCVITRLIRYMAIMPYALSVGGREYERS